MNREKMARSLAVKRRRGLPLLTGETAQDELRVRLLGSAENTAMIAEIRAEAERMLGSGDPELTYALFREYGDTGERLPYERVYFERRKRLNAFALMSLLEPEKPEYAEALRNTVWSVCNEFTWCLPAHYNAGAARTEIDLFAAETGFALSEVLLLAGELLPGLLRSRIRTEVEKRLLHPFLEEGPYGWESADHNWAAVCAGSIGAAAIHLVDDAGRLSRILERVLAAMNCYLSGFGEDGVCAEGYGYWQYGFGYYVYFAQLLKGASEGEFDSFASGKVKAIALFQQKCFTGGKSVVNFSDSLPEVGIFMGLSSCLHREYEEVVLPDPGLRASYAEDHCGRWAPALRNLIWPRNGGTAGSQLTDPRKGGPVWPAEAYYLPDAKWLVSRHIDGDGHIFSFAAKGGHNAEPHNHNDVGHFLIHVDGEAYLADLGSGKYTSHYFGAGRYGIWCNGSQGHSVPIVGGVHQSAGRAYYAEVLEAEAGAKEDRLTLELSAAYPPGTLRSLTRRLRWRKEGLPALELTDLFTFGEEQAPLTRTVVERFITPLEPVTSAAEGKLVLNGKRRLALYYDHTIWEPAIEKRSDEDHFGRGRFWYTIDFKALGEARERLAGHFVFRFENEFID
ncbi:heparinase II/III-family protein [Paenibacillus sp. N4]|uniref:heparinase II/III family protein n=1 Tax=Paenibacillus vietnamensis TaxID=2590547 RepID=UPI001CD09C0B|nr:heparinase II/III family protein [Paenibacillus vietnamensis]MCA0756728.1 heparinase II/III-family protein [Paenibacillus vietnamensis]